MQPGVFTETISILRARGASIAAVAAAGLALLVVVVGVFVASLMLADKAGLAGIELQLVRAPLWAIGLMSASFTFAWVVQAAAFEQSLLSSLGAAVRTCARVAGLYLLPLAATALVAKVAGLAAGAPMPLNVLPYLLVPGVFVLSALTALAAVACALEESQWGMREAVAAFRERPNFVLRSFCVLGGVVLLVAFFVKYAPLAIVSSYLLSIPTAAALLAIYAQLHRAGGGARYAWQRPRGAAPDQRATATAAPVAQIAPAAAAAQQQFTGNVAANGSSEHWIEVGPPYTVTLELQWSTPAPIALYVADPNGQWMDLPAPAQSPYVLELALVPGWHRLVITAGLHPQHYALQVRGAVTAAA